MIFRKYPALKFGFTSAIVFTIDFLLLYVFHSVIGFDLRASIIVAFISAFVVNYLLNRFWVFQKQNPSNRSLVRFTLLVIANLLIQAALIPLSTSIGMHYLVAKSILVAFLFLMNFQISIRYVYKD